jgi:hypothetical protein
MARFVRGAAERARVPSLVARPRLPCGPGAVRRGERAGSVAVIAAVSVLTGHYLSTVALSLAGESPAIVEGMSERRLLTAGLALGPTSGLKLWLRAPHRPPANHRFGRGTPVDRRVPKRAARPEAGGSQDTHPA